MTRALNLLTILLFAGIAACDGGEEPDTDPDTDPVASVTCVECHVSEEMLVATQEPEDTAAEEPESSGEG